MEFSNILLQETLKDEVSRCNVTVTSVNGSRVSAEPYPRENYPTGFGSISYAASRHIVDISPHFFVPAKGVVPNGILKKASVTHMATGPVGHGLTPAILAGAGAALKPKSSGVATKTISFGAK